MVQVSDASTATGEWSATRLVRVLPEEFDMAFETWVVAHEDLQHVRRVRLVMDAVITGLADYAK